MKLRVFIPSSERLDGAGIAWILFDARGRVLREDTTALGDIPRADAVEAILPAARVLFARLRLPRVNAATIRELLPYAGEDRLLADPAQIHVVAGATNARGETVVEVVDRAWLAAMLDALRRAGLRPRQAFAESALVANAPAEWALVYGPQRGLLVDDRGVSVAFDRAGGTELPLAVRIALDEAARRGERPRRIAVHSEADEPPPDLERWRSESGVAFAAGPEWEALRRREALTGAVDLLQGDFAPRSGALAAARIPRAALVLAALIVVLQTVFTAFDAWRLERERRSLEARREAVFRAAFPEARTVVDPDLQMSRNLSELRRARGLAAEDDFLAQLTRAGRAATSPVRSLDYANGKLQAR
jgi:general secretion pathway protein L